MLDEDLADLYGVQTRRLVEQVKRNIERFPPDFMFQLSAEETAALRSQTATSDSGRGGRRYAPYVFTEQGVAMLSGVLRSKRAVAVNTTSSSPRSFKRFDNSSRRPRGRSGVSVSGRRRASSGGCAQLKASARAEHVNCGADSCEAQRPQNGGGRIRTSDRPEGQCERR
jgi:hypothetical protein